MSASDRKPALRSAIAANVFKFLPENVLTHSGRVVSTRRSKQAFVVFRLMGLLKTTSEGEILPHRFLWEIVEEQAALAKRLEREWSKPALVGMVFAFHTVEAYINYLGERLGPEIWQDAVGMESSAR
jgi:hypothetical protein